MAKIDRIQQSDLGTTAVPPVVSPANVFAGAPAFRIYSDYVYNESGVVESKHYKHYYPNPDTLETTMAWLDKLALIHKWTHPTLIDASGFTWKRFNGDDLERFYPHSGVFPGSGNQFGLRNYPWNSFDFWEQFNTINRFVENRLFTRANTIAPYTASGDTDYTTIQERAKIADDTYQSAYNPINFTLNSRLTGFNPLGWPHVMAYTGSMRKYGYYNLNYYPVSPGRDSTVGDVVNVIASGWAAYESGNWEAYSSDRIEQTLNLLAYGDDTVLSGPDESVNAEFSTIFQWSASLIKEYSLLSKYGLRGTFDTSIRLIVQDIVNSLGFGGIPGIYNYEQGKVDFVYGFVPRTDEMTETSANLILGSSIANSIEAGEYTILHTYDVPTTLNQSPATFPSSVHIQDNYSEIIEATGDAFIYLAAIPKDPVYDDIPDYESHPHYSTTDFFFFQTGFRCNVEPSSIFDGNPVNLGTIASMDVGSGVWQFADHSDPAS